MFKYNGSNETIKIAQFYANEIHLINTICANIQMTEKFDMCDCYPIQLGEKFKNFIINRDIEIEIYYPKWRWSKAIGYTTKSKPFTIHVNGYKTGILTSEQWVSNFYHEAGHLVDMYYTDCNCNHGNNNKKGKQNTFQYSLNRFVNKYFGIENKKTYTSPWYIKLWRWLF